ncbi:Fibulin-5 [Saguinus oedipus]|uniref:Fibulin-5 n=1 Tax=Saguinus oedipus TaxID=9490 RepID=A0ABQ9WCM7_SAGOE|nr:Fibulin-5 [Saguinus oedipus]
MYRGPYLNPYSTPYSGPYPAAAPPLSAQNYSTIFRPLICHFGYQMDEGNQCVDVNECATDSHQCNSTQVCINTEGRYTCSCTDGCWLLEAQRLDIDEYRYGYCQQLCANVPGSYSCTCNPGFTLNKDGRSCQDVNEGFKCIDPIRCEEPYLRISDNHCMCPAENPGCRDQPFTILYLDVDVVSGCSVPADIFQMQATTRYPGAYYIFQIKSGNDGREFYVQQTGPISATLVMTRPIKGPQEIQLDLEMITVNTVNNFRGSSVIQLCIYVSQYPF